MDEYIEREAACKAINAYKRRGSPHYNEGIADAANAIYAIPAADVALVRHGRWLSMDSENVIAMDDDGCPVDSCRCSECGDWLTGSDEYMTRGRYCPNCGALMDKRTVTENELRRLEQCNQAVLLRDFRADTR